MAESSVDEIIEYQGRWWLPDSEDRQVPGTLVYNASKGDLLLKINGGLSTGFDFNTIPEYDVIFGFTNKGSISLVDSHVTLSSGPFGSETHIKSRYCFLKAHVPDAKTITFTELAVQFFNLNGWIHRPGVKWKRSSDGSSFEVVYDMPRPIEITLDNGMLITFKPTPHVCCNHGESSNGSIEEQWTMMLHAPSETDFFELWNYVYNVQNLLTLAVTKAVYPTKIIGRGSTKVADYDNTSSDDIEILFPVVGRGTSEEPIVTPLMLFSANLPQDLGLIFNNWFKKANKLEYVYRVHSSRQYAKQPYLNERFLSAVHVIESYHRIVYGIDEEKKLKNDKIMTELIEAFPGYKDTICRLEYAYEPTLKMRLKDLFETCSEVLPCSKQEGKRIVGKTVTTRNYYTHHDESKKKEVASGALLLYLTMRLELMMDVLLMKELGIEDRYIQIGLRNNKNYAYIKELEQKVWVKKKGKRTDSNPARSRHICDKQ